MPDFVSSRKYRVLEESSGSEFDIELEDIPTWNAPGYTLKQFTGKTDADGTELYGGDSVHFPGKKPGDNDVVYHDPHTAEWYAGNVLLSQAARHITKV